MLKNICYTKWVGLIGLNTTIQLKAWKFFVLDLGPSCHGLMPFSIFSLFSSPFGDGKELLKTTLKFSFFFYVPKCKWCNILCSLGLALQSLLGYKYNFTWLKVQNPHSCGISQKMAAVFLQSFHCSLSWVSLTSCGRVPASWSGGPHVSPPPELGPLHCAFWPSHC